MKQKLLIVALCFPLLSLQTAAQTYGRIAQNDDYLSSQHEAIQVKLTHCPGEGDKIYVVGTRPDTKQCIDLRFVVKTNSGQMISTGEIGNFVGGASCYGDSKQIQDFGYPIEELRVQVDDVTYCD